MDTIITANHIFQRDGASTLREWLLIACQRIGGFQTPFTGRCIETNPVNALIDRGRWVAQCECGGCEYVTPIEPIFYCCSCGNYNFSGHARPVIFPDNRVAIETALLKRPVKLFQGRNELERLVNAKPANSKLHRQWLPDTPLEELLDENKAQGIT